MAWRAYEDLSTAYDIIEAMDELLTAIGWKQHMRTTVNIEDGADTSPTDQSVIRTNHCIWEGVGDGTDKIYIQARVPYYTDGTDFTTRQNNQNKTKNYANLFLDSMVGFDEELEFWEQPGSLQQWLKSHEASNVTIPMFTISPNSRFALWLFADTYHIVGVARMSTVYESFHMGFLNPIASERQFPYPMYICGNSHVGGSNWPANETGGFIFPMNYSGWLRRADGAWRAFQTTIPNPDPDTAGTVFPYNSHNTSLISNYGGKDAISQDNFLLLPVMLQTTNPVDVCGVIRDVYWMTGRQDIGAGGILSYGGEQYMIFDTKEIKGDNTYYCVKIIDAEE